MYLPDTNILIYAHRDDTAEHAAYAEWLQSAAETGTEPLALADTVLSSFLRLVTNPSIFRVPSSPEVAIAFCEELLGLPNVVLLYPGTRHWELFTGLVRRVGARGNLIPDTYIAALALEYDCEVITNDRDFARFPGVRWRHPLVSARRADAASGTGPAC